MLNALIFSGCKTTIRAARFIVTIRLDFEALKEDLALVNLHLEKSEFHILSIDPQREIYTELNQTLAGSPI